MTKKWTVIRRSGAAETFWGPDECNVSGKKDYLEVLDHVYRDMMTGGSTYDCPNMLLSDGSVVVESGLTDLAYAYGTDLRNAYEHVRNTTGAKHNRVFTKR